MNGFKIPVVLFFFRRKDKIVEIIERLSQVKPEKIYLISDGPRNENEKIQVNECREAVENSINWDCQIVKNYSSENSGVYDRIGLGAKWVFEKEDVAIFLEDDNLPELSFFNYCEELLEKYKNDNRILWVCGTNYLEDYTPEDNASYVFTKHLLPCGWASWSDKFNQYYDGELKLLDESYIYNRLSETYRNKALYKQQKHSIDRTKYLLEHDRRSCSWDHQMSFSIRANGLYGISPSVNQIKNIGVDEFSEHGGTSLDIEMTNRFCGMDSKELQFPLNHPKSVMEDSIYERRVGNIILLPKKDRFYKVIARYLKPLIGLKQHDSFKEWITKTFVQRKQK
jgi:hypothetical protein